MLSLFSGIGSPETALKRLGIEVELFAFSEIDKYAVKSYCAVHVVDENLNLGDITKIQIENLPKDIEIITHGSPCQDFSVAGNNRGGDVGTGTRSSLMWNTVAITEHCKPKYVLWENVKNVLSKKHIHNFEKYISEMERIGYKNFHKVLNAKDYGVPQNRERIFVISIRNDIEKSFEFPKGFDNGIRLKDILEPIVDEKYYINTEKAEKLISEYKGNLAISHPIRSREFEGQGWKENCPTLCARDYKDPKNIILPTEPNVLRFERTEYGKQIRKQYENGEIEEKIGNMREPKPRTDGISNTLTTVQKDNMLVIPCITPDRLEKRQNGRRFKEDGEPMFTITSQDRHGVLCVDDTQGYDGTRFYNDETPTLRASRSGLKVVEPKRIGGIVDGETKHQAGSVWDKEGLAPTLDTMQGGYRQPCIIEDSKSE